MFKLAYKPNSITDPQTTALILDKMFYQLSFQDISLIVQSLYASLYDSSMLISFYCHWTGKEGKTTKDNPFKFFSFLRFQKY